MLLPHSIRRQTLDVEVGSEALALALQPRLADFNRRRVVRVLERVLEELDVPGRHVRLDRLEIDLGTLPLVDFETAAEQRLERELRRALSDAVREAAQSPAGGRRAHSADEARRELLSHYLEHGTLPFWGPRARGFAFDQLVAQMAEADPRGLVAVVRRLGQRPQVLERIVGQLGEAQLQRLIGLLEPEHAALIVAYVGDLQQVHRVEPLLALGASAFARALWLLTQAYLVRDPGSQFNRRSFVRSLLAGLATRAGLDYRDLLATLRLGLERTRRRYALHASFPAVVGELLRDAESGAAPIEEPARAGGVPDATADALGRLEHDLATGEMIPPGGLAALWRGLDAPARARARRRLCELASAGASERAALAERLLRAADRGALLALLAPSQRAVLAALPGLFGRAGATLSAASDARVTWERAAWQALVEALLVARPGRWALRAVVRRTLEQVADRVATTPERLIDALRVARRTSRAASALEHELCAAQAAPDGRPATALFNRYDQVALLQHFARYGRLPWRVLLRAPGLTPARALHALFELPLPLVRAVFDADTSEAQLAGLTRVARALTRDDLARLVARLVPQAAQETPLRGALASFAEQARDPAAFFAGLIAAALDGRALDLEALVESDGVSSARAAAQSDAPELKAALVAALHGAPGPGATAPDLLRALVAGHAADARQVLRALRAEPSPRAALVRAAPDGLYFELLGLLCPAEAAMLRALHDALLALPSPYRPRPDEAVREALFDMALGLDAGQRVTPALFARLLRGLFTPSMPAPVTRFLAQRGGEWTRAGALPASHVAAFEAALGATGPDDSEAPATTVRPAAERIEPALREAVFAFLLEERQPVPRSGEAAAAGADAPPPLLSDEELGHALETLLAVAPDDVRAFVRRHTEDARRREHWARVLSEAALVRLMHLLEPRRQRALLDAAEVLASAWHASLPAGHKTLARREIFWSFVLEFLARCAPAERSLERLAAAFSEFFAARYRATAPGHGGDNAVGARLFEEAGRLARAAGNGALVAVLQRGRSRLLAPWETPTSPAVVAGEGDGERRAEAEGRRPSVAEEPPRPLLRRERQAEPDASSEPIYVDNAGLVLAGAFLPHLFQTLDLLAPDEKGRPRLRDAGAASRAVHLLQFLVDGRTSAPEPALVLNKILCGLAPSTPIERAVDLAPREIELAESLLRAMIARWTIISSTSVAGLRETFLQREGRLRHSGDGWRLHVQRKTLDVLVDQIPWSVSVVLHAWMPEPVHVTW